jgi:ABC-type multidrug transport system permease subunit
VHIARLFFSFNLSFGSRQINTRRYVLKDPGSSIISFEKPAFLVVSMATFNLTFSRSTLGVIA